MRQNVYYKLYISFLIFAFLIFIIPSVFTNTIGFMFLGLTSPIMFLSKAIDLLIFISIAIGINIIVIFIIWLNIRTVKKDDTFIRPINGLEFKKENFIQIRKKKFGLMTLATFELNNYKNIHYFFNNDNDLRSFLEENDLIEFLVDKEYKFNKIKFWIKTGVFVLLLGIVFRDSITTNKTFRKGYTSVSFGSYYQDKFAYNNDHLVTINRIYNLKDGSMLDYKTNSSFEVNSEYYYHNDIYDIEVYNDYFICKFFSTKMKRNSPNSPNGSGIEEYKNIEEKIDYNGQSMGFLKNEDIDYVDSNVLYPDSENIAISGMDIDNYIYHGGSGLINYPEHMKAIYKFCYSKRKGHSCYNLSGNTIKIDDYCYFSLHVYGKREDTRYIQKSGVYRYNFSTGNIDTIKEFKGKRILSINSKHILYLDYKTIYKFDMENNKKTKVIKLADYKDTSVRSYKDNITISCYMKNKDYYLDKDYNLIAIVKTH